MLDSAQNFYIKEIENGNNNPILNRNMGYGFFSFGYIMQYKKEFEKAIIYLNKSKTYLKDFPSDLAAIGSRLAECNLGLNNIEEAEKIAIKNLQFKNLNEQEKTYNYRVLEKIYKRKKMDKKLLMVKDSLILMATGFSKIKTTKSLNNFETEIKLANSSRELNESKIKHNTYLYISIICFIILISAIFGIRINYNLQKEVASRLEAEKKLISSELSQKNRELVSKTNFILQRNEYLKKIQGKLDSDQFNTDETKSVAFNLNSVISSEKLYKDFDKMFVNVYPNFYLELNKVAKLSTTDLRLASLIKMNHNNNEIAIISGVSLRTIESQRYRLSKKLKLKKNQSLNSLLLAI
jgi:DNA-binding CsgD family transcriptional regulator